MLVMALLLRKVNLSQSRMLCWRLEGGKGICKRTENRTKRRIQEDVEQHKRLKDSTLSGARCAGTGVKGVKAISPLNKTRGNKSGLNEEECIIRIILSLIENSIQVEIILQLAQI